MTKKRTRRANGEGSVYQLPPERGGTWVATFSYTDRATGKQKRHYSYGKTRKEATDKRKLAQQRHEAGAPVRDATETLGSFTARWITTTLEASSRKATTKENYGNIARRHLVEGRIGVIPLGRVTPTDVEELLTASRSGRASSTVRSIYTVLRAVLDTAVRDKLLAANAAALVKRPRVERKDARYLTGDEAKRLLSAAKDKSLYPLLLVLLTTGLRRGEALALRWSDVDLDQKHVRVCRTVARVRGELVFTEPKSARSRRTINFHDSVPAALRAHRAHQAAERLAAGSQWQQGHDLVFASQIGTPLDPRNVLRRVKEVAQEAGLPPGVAVHTLRHTYASASIQGGVHMRVVQENLGHSSFSVTADVYAHVAPAQQREAAAAVGAALGL